MSLSDNPRRYAQALREDIGRAETALLDAQLLELPYIAGLCEGRLEHYRELLAQQEAKQEREAPRSER